MSRRVATERAVRTPWPLLLLAAFAVAFFLLPLLGLALRAPWLRLGSLLASAEVQQALWLSLSCSLGATGLAFVLGLPLAVWLASGRSIGRTSARVLVTLPMVLPPVVGGLALLLVYGRAGVVGGWTDAWFGVALPFSSEGVVVAEAYVAMPFFVLTVEGGLRSLNRRYQDVAATLGASPWRVFWTVTLPMLGPSLTAGLLVAWARALGEFGATITFAGSFAGETRTLPLAVYRALEDEPDAAIALSLLLVGVSVVVLFVLRQRWFPARAVPGGRA